MSGKFSIWSGVYDSFEEVKGTDNFHGSSYWIEKQKQSILKKINSEENHKSYTKDYPLSIACSMILGQQNNIKVLDFGGGMGHQYIDLIHKSDLAKDRTDYYVIDGPETINNVPDELNRFSNLHFFDNLDKVSGCFDVVHIGSTLQYIENSMELLEQILLKFTPNYIVLSDLLAGAIPTFITGQKHYENTIPIKMLNVNDVYNILTPKYIKVYGAQYSAGTLGVETLVNHDLPEINRLKYTLNFIFKKS